MNGKETCVVLGAGASRCYRMGHGSMPMQADMAASLFTSVRMEGSGYLGGIGGSHGLRQSERLGDFIRRSLGLAERDNGTLYGFWTELQERGYTLERLYDAVRQSSVGVAEWAPAEFEAIVRSLLLEKVDRSIAGCCDCHRALVQALEPGDLVLNFNWDTLASDAMYYFNRLWFPATGFGGPAQVLGKHPADRVAAGSQITILHPHGCVALHAVTDDDGSEQHAVVYVAPETYDSGSSRFEYSRIPEKDSSDGKSGALRHLPTEEHTRFNLGWIRVPSGPWLKPLFLPPEPNKHYRDHWYHRGVTRALHSALPRMEKIVVIGYSLPPADLDGLRTLFVSDVMSGDYDLVVVNSSNFDPVFQTRVLDVFQTSKPANFSCSDFVEYCSAFLGPEDRRVFVKNRGIVTSPPPAESSQ